MQPGYIYKPPPPPPIPKPPPPEGGNQHPQFPSHRGGRGRGESGGGYRGGRGRGGGSGRGGSHGGYGGYQNQQFSPHQQHHYRPQQAQPQQIYHAPSQAPQLQPQPQTHPPQAQAQAQVPPFSQYPRGAHINPQFFPGVAAGLQQQYPQHHQHQQPQNPQQSPYHYPHAPPPPPPQPQTTPQSLFPSFPPQNRPSLFSPAGQSSDYTQKPVTTSSYRSYTQEYTTPAPPPRHPPPVAPPTWPAQPSYGHYQPPPPPPPPRQYSQHPYSHNQYSGRGSDHRGGRGPPNKRLKRGDEKVTGWEVKDRGRPGPDMDHDTWMRLNGGKIIGTNISLDTPEDVEAWIKERKARWPTAERIKQRDEERKKATEEEAKRRAAESERKVKVTDAQRKEKKKKKILEKKKKRIEKRAAKEAAAAAALAAGRGKVEGLKRKRGVDDEGDADIDKAEVASNHHPENEGNGEQADVDKGIEGAILDVKDKSIQTGHGTSDSSSTAPNGGEGISTGLLELEKILGSAKPTLPKEQLPLTTQDANENPIADDRIIDYDSQASDFEGVPGAADENEEVDDDKNGHNEIRSFSTDMSMSASQSDDDSDDDSSQDGSSDDDSDDDSDDSDDSHSDDSDAEEISSKELPSGVLPPTSENNPTTITAATASHPQTLKQKKKNKRACRAFLQKGTCVYGDDCRYSHSTKPGSAGNSRPDDHHVGDEAGNRISLHERLMMQQREKESEIVVRAVKWLFEEGGLEKPPNATELEKEMREEQLRRVMGGGERRKNGNGRGRGGGGMRGRGDRGRGGWMRSGGGGGGGRGRRRGRGA